MANFEKSPDTTPELQELAQAVDRVIQGVRDPVAMRRAAERMDRMRQEMRETNIAVELIRETRDEA